MINYNPYLAGEFVDTNEHIFVKVKYNNSDFCKLGMANSLQLEKAINVALSVEKEMANFTTGQIFDILKEISDKLYEKREFFAEIISKECGKPLKYSRIEAERASQTFLIAAEESKRIQNEIISLDWYPYGERREAIIKHFPVGLVSGITPFNFPLNLVAHKVAPAIAAKCPIILKPSLLTPISALELAKIIDNTSLPKGAFSVLPMTHEVCRPLIEDERVKKLSFTGSPQAGWQMKQNCGKKRITLELGGNAGCIVGESANIEEAVNKCVTGSFAYSGQVCIHTQRLLVNESKYELFLNKFVEKTKKLKYGNPLDVETDISVVIDEKNAIRIEEWINEAQNEGAKIVCGGKRNNSFIEPTVLINTKPSMKVCKDEIFGPVVCIEPYSDFKEAIEYVNNSKYGLQAGVFTNKIDEMNYAFENIQVGGVMINEVPTFRVDHMPYGGIKESGFGREGLKYAIIEMSNLKVMVKPS